MTFLTKSLFQIAIFWLILALFLLAITPKTALFPASLGSLLLLITAILIRKKCSLFGFLFEISWLRFCVFAFIMIGSLIHRNNPLEYIWALPMVLGLILLVEAITFRIHNQAQAESE